MSRVRSRWGAAHVRRAAPVALFVLVLLVALVPPGRAATVDQVQQDFYGDGSIAACAYTLDELRAVRHGASGQSTLAFRKALRAAITQRRAAGVCKAGAGTSKDGEGLSDAVLVGLGFLGGLLLCVTVPVVLRRRRARRRAAAKRAAARGEEVKAHGSKGTGYRQALRHTDLRRLFGGLAISATGSWAYNVALLAFVFERTHSLGWVGAAGLGRFVPALVFSAYSGVVADRFERVRLMISSDLLCVVWQVGLAATAALDGPVTLAIALAGLTAISNVVYNPAVAAMLPQIAGEDDLAAANALNGTIEELSVIAGPAIGAGVVALGSPALAFGVNAGTFAVSALLVVGIKARSTPVDVTEDGAGPLRQMVVGAKTIFASPAARVLVAFSSLASFVYGTDTVLFVGVSDQRLGTGATGFGYLLAGLGLGGILMATTVNRLAGANRLALIITGGMVFYCLPTALLTVVHEPVIAFALQVVRGAATLVVDVLAVTALQRAVPSDVMARVFGVFFAFVLGAISLGALIAPGVVNALGLDGGLVLFAVAPVALSLLGLPALLRLDRDAVALLAELAPRISVLESLGIFAAATRPVLERLAVAVKETAVPAGTAIVREGDEADALYVLIDGEVEVTARGEGHATRHLRDMGPGTFFGEIGLLERIPRTATVTASKECKLYRIDGEAFLDALTTARPSGSFVEGARTGLARTHPSLRMKYEPPEPGSA